MKTKELNKEQFDKLPNGEIFVKGEVENSPLGLYMTPTDIGKMLRWIAIKGSENDWAIYTFWAERSWKYVRSNGEKITGEKHIRKLVPCTDEVYELYRY